MRPEDTDDCYYRLQRTPRGEINVCCLQWFDENDYDKTLWLRDEKGEVLVFTDEEEAEKYKATYALKAERVAEALGNYAVLGSPMLSGIANQAMQATWAVAIALLEREIDRVEGMSAIALEGMSEMSLDHRKGELSALRKLLAIYKDASK
ncbi:MAG: hypothetical protein E6R03_14745 [Hyphomicrobiaceae bacterium]|nr:MAG: hypothetical protein E6R03_14745 [Hyphomicrobiaceae bacterium]